MNELFSASGAKPVLDLPSHIDWFCNNAQVSMTPDEIIQLHTLFPYYQAFLSPTQAHRVRSDMRGVRSMSINGESGIMASRVLNSKRISCCPVCIEEDVKVYGEPYWHRAHHLPGVNVCPIHGMRLYTCCPICEIPLGAQQIQEPPVPVTHCRNGHSLIVPEQVIEPMHISLAQDSVYVLLNPLPVRTLSQMRQDYINALAAMGLVTPNGRIRQQSFLSLFRGRIPQTFLDVIGVPPSTRDDTHWAADMLRRPRHSHHPILHILMMEFICGSVANYFANPKYQPFGDGPWPCLNKVGSHYGEDVIPNVTITRCTDTGRPVGTFHCECGFVYSRRGPDRSSEDRLRYGRVKVFGRVWEEKFELIAKDSPSIRDLARQMHTDSKVIKRYQHSNSNSIRVSNVEADRKLRRSQFLETIQANSELTRTALRKRNPKDYIWLYRNDNDWLMTVLPAVVERVTLNRVSRVNWVQRDLELSHAAEKAIIQLQEQTGKPKRITLSAVGRLIGHKGLLEKHLDKLTITKSVLVKHVESHAQYQIRRIDWAISELIESSEPPLRWKVLRKSGIRPELSIDINRYVEERLKSTGLSDGFTTQIDIGGKHWSDGTFTSETVH